MCQFNRTVDTYEWNYDRMYKYRQELWKIYEYVHLRRIESIVLEFNNAKMAITYAKYKI